MKLCAAARDHSKDMATLGFFAHESPVEGKRTPLDAGRALRDDGRGREHRRGAGDRACGGACWWPPGHHKNMLGGGSRTALGRHGSHWTQLFGG